MRTQQIHLKNINELNSGLDAITSFSPDLIIAFGSVNYFDSPLLAQQLKTAAPEAVISGCSTAGEIAADRVYDNSCIITLVKFDHSQVKAVTTRIENMNDSFNAGTRLGQALPKDELSGVLILGTGVAINGSALVSGLQSTLPAGVTISGGLAADGGAFKQTWTLGPAGSTDNNLVAIGLYGSHLRLQYGTFAGWEPFGPTRKVTRSEENVLYELDGEPALSIYKRYLGEYAKDLPGSGLLFPFEMLGSALEKQGIFRTILAVNEDTGSLTLAGDIDPNGYLRLMHASTEKLIQGAETAAQTATHSGTHQGNSLALLVSCIGRKLVMGDRVDEEVEAVADTLGKNTCITGFYSNGEIAGTSFHSECRLHNQTMTITWISED